MKLISKNYRKFVAVCISLFLLILAGLRLNSGQKESNDYFPLVFSGIPSELVLQEVAKEVHRKVGARATWILHCQDVTGEDDALRKAVKKLRRVYGDGVGYSLRAGMGLSSGGGVESASREEVFDELDICFTEFERYFGEYPVLHLWISDISILRHIREEYGSSIAITANWQQYKTDTASAAGSFDYPFYPSVNHPLVPGKDAFLDILNYEVEHPDLYWSKISGTRPVFEPINSNTLEQMQLLTDSVFIESDFDDDTLKLLPTIIELGYIYGGAMPNNMNLEKISLFKDWLQWLYQSYPDLNYVTLLEFGDKFREQQQANDRTYALLQSGSAGAWSGHLYPSRSSEYKTFMFWSSEYRARLDIKVGDNGWIRLSDYTPYSDSYLQGDSPQDISIYQGMNHLELANVGLKEEWIFGDGKLALNFPSEVDVDHTVILDGIHKDGQDYVLSFRVRLGGGTIYKVVRFAKNGISYGYRFENLSPTSFVYEVFKATYNSQMRTNEGVVGPLISGTYLPESGEYQKILIGDFYISDTQNLGEDQKMIIVQGEDTPLEWSSSSQPDDKFIPDDFSSITKMVSYPSDGELILSLRGVE